MSGCRLNGYLGLLLLSLSLAVVARAADLSTPGAFTQEELLQKQRREAVEARLQPQPPDIRLRTAPGGDTIHFLRITLFPRIQG